jgi:2-dehydropantoate 2-reductase
MDKAKRVAIVGAGAVGQMIAYLLQSVGFEVDLYGRDGPRNLSVAVSLGDRMGRLEIRSQNREADIWLFATKAYDLVSALMEWLPQISKDRPLVLLANGFIEPVLTDVRRQFPGRMLRKAVVSRGAKFDEEGRLLISPRGEILWGAASGDEPCPVENEIMAALKDEGFRWDARACEARKTKWYCNTVLNTLAGARRLPRNGDALHQKEFASLCHEVYELGLEFWPEWKGQEEALKLRLNALIAMTSDNENSMAVDVRLGRRTESKFLSGYVKAAENAQKRFPYLYELHQKLEVSS